MQTDVKWAVYTNTHTLPVRVTSWHDSREAAETEADLLTDLGIGGNPTGCVVVRVLDRLYWASPRAGAALGTQAPSPKSGEH